jgi:glycyl-radical enzyme activating protein
MIKAPVFNIARASLHDGRGIRTVVYLKGCPLRCAWCHNPEGIGRKPEILYHESRCIRCGRCISLCPDRHKISNGGAVYLRRGCTACGNCAEACPAEALVLCGEEMTPEALFEEIARDSIYYGDSGGVTFSGGESLLYPEFIAETLKKCRDAGINTAVETSLCVPAGNIKKVIGLTDTFIVDIKHADSEMHRALTGRDNARILENLSFLSAAHSDILIRIPLIPGQNDGEENLVRTAALINSFGPGIKAVELLKYNNLAQNKYAAAGKRYRDFGSPQSDAEIKSKTELVKKHLRDGIAVLP